MKGKKTKKILALFLAVVMSVTMIVPAFAAQEGDIDADQERATLTYDAPTEPMAVDDTVITATAHRAASPVLGMMGLNATSGFGMINGSAPTDLESAETCFALGVWGTTINSNPDPYYWNYFYNFYAAENGLELSDDALVNESRASSPGGADTTLMEEYGNVSVSLSSRPEIVIGCSGSSGGSDTSGYDNQLATINSFTSDSAYYQEGDETYSPYLISYQMTYIKQMIESVYRIANAIDEIEEADSSKHTRYDDDPDADYYITADQTAEKYESYVYGAISYVQSRLAADDAEEKVVAVVTKINEDGTYTLADSGAASATSLVRGWEYAYGVSTSLLEVIDKTSSDAVTEEELLQADAIISINNSNITAEALIDSFETEYTGTIIDETPSSLYGMTMNSVENAMGYAFVIGCLYPEYIDPVEWCAYFYETFLHVTDQASIQQCVDVNFADVSLPSGVSTTLTDYSAAAIEEDIAEGYAYYSAHKDDQFTAEAKDGFYELNGLTEWGTRSASSDEEQSLIVTGDTEYSFGEELNLTVRVELSDGITKNVPVSECTITGYDSSVGGAQTVTITYGTLTATYDVEVTGTVEVIAGDETITVDVAALEEAAEEQTFTRVKGDETTEITANFVSIYDILDAAGVDYDACTVVTATASDDFSKDYAIGGEDATEVYLYLEDGAYRSAVDGSAANMWVSGVITITVTEDHPDDAVVTDAAVAATCTEDGLTEGSHCSVCGEVLVAQEVIPATGHTVVTDAAVEATCTTDGLTEGSHCSVCGEVLVAQEVIPAAHTWDDGVIVTEAPSYTGKGVKTYTCTVCGETKDEVYTFINGTVTSGVRTAILWAAESGISKGYTTGADAGTFGVGNTVTREEMVIFLYRLAGYTGENTSARAAITFNDADEIKTTGGETAISWAVAEGITSGYSDGSGNFGPQDECTREQICIFLWRLAGKPAVTDEELAAVSDFADADEISNTTAEKAIAWAYSEGIVRGYTDSDDFGPTDSCLREQFAIMMYRYANN